MKKSKLGLKFETVRTLTSGQLSGIGGGATTLISFENVCQPSYGPTGTHFECPTARRREN